MKSSEARTPMDEQSLIQQVQEGKLEAFGHLMDLHEIGRASCRERVYVLV